MRPMGLVKSQPFSSGLDFARWIGMLDLFGEFSRSLPVERETRAYRYRVLVVWLSEAGELLGQVSRPLSHTAAKKLWSRCLRADSDVLDVHMFNVAEPVPAIPGVRLLDALDARELVRIDRTDLFEGLLTVSPPEPASESTNTVRHVTPGDEND
jgi:hypothetical protein